MTYSNPPMGALNAAATPAADPSCKTWRRSSGLGRHPEKNPRKTPFENPRPKRLPLSFASRADRVRAREDVQGRARDARADVHARSLAPERHRRGDDETHARRAPEEGLPLEQPLLPVSVEVPLELGDAAPARHRRAERRV
jgi:hypothetical protein